MKERENECFYITIVRTSKGYHCGWYEYRKRQNDFSLRQTQNFDIISENNDLVAPSYNNMVLFTYDNDSETLKVNDKGSLRDVKFKRISASNSSSEKELRKIVISNPPFG